jgi:pantothenate kinase type III
MVEALLTRTALIRGRAKLRGRGASPGLARDTRAAIGSGSVQAIAAIAIHAQQLARGLLKTPVQLLLSGGGAAVTARALALRPGRAALPLAATDLVLTGLSVLAAQSKR